MWGHGPTTSACLLLDRKDEGERGSRSPRALPDATLEVALAPREPQMPLNRCPVRKRGLLMAGCKGVIGKDRKSVV